MLRRDDTPPDRADTRHTDCAPTDTALPPKLSVVVCVSAVNRTVVVDGARGSQHVAAADA